MISYFRDSILAWAGIFGAVSLASAQPAFLFQPQSQTVSFGANVFLQVSAFGPGPIAYQWYKNGQPIPGQTVGFLYLASVSAADQGDYTAVATMFSQSVTSLVATLLVDGTFTKITRDPLVTDPGVGFSAVWEDYDNDGFPDVFMVRAGVDFNQLYHNNGDGSFTPVVAGALGNDFASSQSAAWADYDNDGWLDLLVVNSQAPSVLYRNNRDGTFVRTDTGVLGTETANSISAAWGDYDRDGWLDVYFGNDFNPNFLYHNDRNGRFTKVTTPPIVGGEPKVSLAVVWGDTDNDGDLDLFVANLSIGTFLPGHENLFVNDGNGGFTSLVDDPLVSSAGASVSTTLVDYDNDGDLDAVVFNEAPQSNAVFRNNGSNHFVRVEAGDLTTNGEQGGDSRVASWGDYDNDGWLDVFVVNFGSSGFLYRNHGDGSFTRIFAGSVANDGGSSLGCAWVDYNRDGFLDLHVSNVSGGNFLYRNNGNSNAWLNVRCRSITNNRFGVGAKVKVRATIGGVSHWQLREINAGDGQANIGTLDAHFGLGNAVIVEEIRVEWPGGAVLELHQVAVNQMLTLDEPGFSLPPIVLTEGDEGLRAVQIPVILAYPPDSLVTVEYFTRNGTALAGVDYVPTAGLLAFTPGQLSNSVTVNILTDVIDEGDETFFVTLTNATLFPALHPEGLVTIVDDDPLTMAVTDTETTEGDVGMTEAVFTIVLSKPSPLPASASYRTVPNVATEGVDYVGIANGIVNFAPGETSRPVVVQIIGDTIHELTERFGIRLVNVTNATRIARTGTCDIKENDPVPEVLIENSAVREGNVGSTPAMFRLTLSSPSSRAVTVDYSAIANTASAGSDFVAQAGTITFAAGTTNQTINITVQSDLLPEPAETFLLQLLNPINAVLSRSQAAGRILDDDIQAYGGNVTAQGFRFAFKSMAGLRYRVESTFALGSTSNWVVVPGWENVLGTGASLDVIDPNPTELQRFYRVVLLEP